MIAPATVPATTLACRCSHSENVAIRSKVRRGELSTGRTSKKQRRARQRYAQHKVGSLIAHETEAKNADELTAAASRDAATA
jgi:hypothetical protein